MRPMETQGTDVPRAKSGDYERGSLEPQANEVRKNRMRDVFKELNRKTNWELAKPQDCRGPKILKTGA
jgi:hypothetical protein